MLRQWMEESQENVATTPFPPPPFFLVFLPPFLPQYSMTEEYIMQHFFFFFLPSSFLSPTTLLLPSQVASRVTAGFAEAHACWQHTVTDLVAERKKLTEPQCKNPVFILETATLQFGPWISPKTFLC